MENVANVEMLPVPMLPMDNGEWRMLPMWKCCQFQCCQWTMGSGECCQCGSVASFNVANGQWGGRGEWFLATKNAKREEGFRFPLP